MEAVGLWEHIDDGLGLIMESVIMVSVCDSSSHA
jgi:hypothetical protein